MNDLTGRTTYTFSIRQEMDWGHVVITGDCAEYPLDQNAPRYPCVKAEIHTGDGSGSSDCCTVDFGGRLYAEDPELTISWNGRSRSDTPSAVMDCQQMAMALQHASFMADRWNTEGLHATFDRLYSLASRDGDTKAFTKIWSDTLEEGEKNRKEAERNVMRAALAKKMHEGDKVIELADAIADRFDSSDAVMRRATHSDRSLLWAITEGDVGAITDGRCDTPESLTKWLCNIMRRCLVGDRTKKGGEIYTTIGRLRERASTAERAARHS